MTFSDTSADSRIEGNQVRLLMEAVQVFSLSTDASSSRNVTGLRLKGVGARIRNEWYEELVKSGSKVTPGRKKAILKKINETDPWYGLETLTSWVYGRRSRDKKRATGAGEIPSQSDLIKIEDTGAAPLSQDVAACVIAPAPAPKSRTIWDTLDKVRLAGIDGKLQAKDGRTETLPNCELPAEGRSPEISKTTSASPASSLTPHDSLDGSIPQLASLIPCAKTPTVNRSAAKIFAPGPLNNYIPQTFEQFSAQLEPYESSLDNILKIMDQY